MVDVVLDHSFTPPIQVGGNTRQEVVKMQTYLIVLSIVLAVLVGFFGYKWKQVKQLLKDLVVAIEDDKVTEEEFQALLKSIKELFNMK